MVRATVCFVMPITKNEPRRVTHHPDDFGVINSGNRALVMRLEWTPDGRRIFFSSRRRGICHGGVTPIVQLFTVPVEGCGPATPVPLIRAANT